MTKLRAIRFDDGFSEGVLEMPLGDSPIDQLVAGVCYGREVQTTLYAALSFIKAQGLQLRLDRSPANLRFFLWMETQKEFSRAWYFGMIYFRYVGLFAAAHEAAEDPARFPDALTMLLDEAMAIGGLCREYELSVRHKKRVLVRKKQLAGFGSYEASAQRAEANARRREEAEAWHAIARETAARSRLRGEGLANEIRKKLKLAGIQKSPSSRTIRKVIKDVRRGPD